MGKAGAVGAISIDAAAQPYDRQLPAFTWSGGWITLKCQRASTESHVYRPNKRPAVPVYRETRPS